MICWKFVTIVYKYRPKYGHNKVRDWLEVRYFTSGQERNDSVSVIG